MGIRLSPLGVAVFCLLGVGVIYHLYAGVISTRLAALRSDMRQHDDTSAIIINMLHGHTRTRIRTFPVGKLQGFELALHIVVRTKVHQCPTVQAHVTAGAGAKLGTIALQTR